MNSVENVLKVMTGNGTAALYMFFSESPFCKGVSVFFNTKCNVDIMTVEHFFLINAEIDNNYHTFINIYAPNKETNRSAFFLVFLIRLSLSILNKIVKF